LVGWLVTSVVLVAQLVSTMGLVGWLVGCLVGWLNGWFHVPHTFGCEQQISVLTGQCMIVHIRGGRYSQPMCGYVPKRARNGEAGVVFSLPVDPPGAASFHLTHFASRFLNTDPLFWFVWEMLLCDK